MIEKYYKQTFDKINMDVAVKQRIRDEIMKSSPRKGRKNVPLSVHIGLAAAAAFALIICIPQTRALVLAAGDYVAGLFTDNAETVTVPADSSRTRFSYLSALSNWDAERSPRSKRC